ncbi:MAG: HNH endonuclease [Pseudomonadota bacterium]
MKRSYLQKTLKVLFALSGNQCAHPECTNTLIESATENSDAFVTAHICHIYAISTDGPRGKPGLTQKELNSPENLILLCRHHHGVVDGQHETYPAAMLKEWKQSHESKMQKRLSADLESVQPDIFSHSYFVCVERDSR